jgi:WS/DGAT/MGAT family acyltransferase
VATTSGDPARGRASARPRPRLERASATDLAFLAMDTGSLPEQFAVILRLDRAGDLDLARVRQLIGERIRAVPRLRQRLIRVPPGCGGPIWADVPEFDLARHVRAVRCGAPGDERALLDTALSVILARLPGSAPLWSATLITDLADDAAALVVVLNHVLADGVGGLAVLAALVDPGAAAADVAFPRPRPATASLLRDAWLARAEALRHAPRSWRLLRRAMSAGGGFRPRPATPCSLVARTGLRRTMVAVRVDRARLRAAAHRHGATTNDAVLVAVVGALHQVLLARGESVDPIVVTVPVSGRGSAGDPALGNLVSPLVVDVPTGGEVGQRLAQVADAVRAGKEAATGPPPIAVLGWLFRPLARLGGFRFYMNHQHRFHTLVSHVRGPDRPVTFGGHQVGSAIPVGVGEGGNVTAHVEVLSYAGEITISAILDPDHFPEVDRLADLLAVELDRVIAAP